MPPLRSGFLIVKTFDALYRTFYHRTPAGKAIYSIPQEATDPGEVAKKYRGLDRDPLTGLSLERLARVLRQKPEAIPGSGHAATLAMAHLEEHERAAGFLVRSLQDARDVLVTLGEPEHWEIMWARVANDAIDPPAQTELLGYEPSYFPEGFFSTVCDSMCFPRWHGTDEKGVLFRDYHERLNDKALFNSPGDAADFLDFYLSFDWTERGEYSIAAVYELSHALRAKLIAPPDFVVVDDAGRDQQLGQTLPGMTWHIRLRSIASDSKIRGVKTLWELTGMGIAEAKALVESLPRDLLLVYVGEAEGLRTQLLGAGFEIDMTLDE